MAALTAWQFRTELGAEQALSTLTELSTRHVIEIDDAAVVTWPIERRIPRTRQLAHSDGTAALGGSFWDLLFGLIFFVPLLDADRPVTGDVVASLRDVGIDDDFIDSIRIAMKPGSSALFVMSENAVVDRVRAELRGMRAELVEANLTAEQEALLRSVFESD